MIWRIFKYLQHLFYRKHRKGHGIHSPYVFELVNGVVFQGDLWVVPERIRQIHRDLGVDRKMIPEGDRQIRSFVREASVSRKYGALLFRIAGWMKPQAVLELGTGLGVSMLYLASGVKSDSGPGAETIPVFTIEGDASRAAFAEELFKRFELSGVKVLNGDLDRELEGLKRELPDRYLAFVDGNHRYEPTLGYLRTLIAGAGEEAVIVMDDIYWSGGMYRAWKEIISWPEVRVSIDLFHMGILLLRKDLHKTHYKIKF